MEKGQIQSLVAEKGFGFIRPESGGPDVFFHRSAVDAPLDTIAEGQTVQFEIDANAEKPRARVVQTGSRSPVGVQAAGGQTEAPRGRSARAGSRPTESRRPPRRDGPAAYEFGFVTKLYRKKFIGFISSVKNGPEFRFAAENVRGVKRFSQLQIGDYVQFLVGESDPANHREPVAKLVHVVERDMNVRSEKQLDRHPKARKKKPSWR